MGSEGGLSVFGGSDRPFQSALETGVRSLAVLAEAHPESFDLQRLLYFDYLVVHSGDADGPESLHANTPLRNGELLVRRGLVERGALLMVSRGLLERHLDGSGIRFTATDDAEPFLECLTSKYARELRFRAHWAVDRFGSYDDATLRAYFDSNFERWTREFQSIRYSTDIAEGDM